MEKVRGLGSQDRSKDIAKDVAEKEVKWYVQLWWPIVLIVNNKNYKYHGFCRLLFLYFRHFPNPANPPVTTRSECNSKAPNSTKPTWEKKTDSVWSSIGNAIAIREWIMENNFSPTTWRIRRRRWRRQRKKQQGNRYAISIVVCSIFGSTLWITFAF